MSKERNDNIQNEMILDNIEKINLRKNELKRKEKKR